MSRKPANLELSGGKGLRQRTWERIRKYGINSGRLFSLDDLLVGADVASHDTARDYLTGLANAGYLARRQIAVTTGPTSGRHPARFELVNDAGAEAPRVRKDGTPVTMGLAQEQMWRTLRMLKSDTNARELAAHASTPVITVKEVAAADYLKHLHRANYLQCTAPARVSMRNGGRSPARYRLISNTGPRPPMVCRTDAIYDPNLDETVWVRPVTEEVAIYGH